MIRPRSAGRAVRRPGGRWHRRLMVLSPSRLGALVLRNRRAARAPVALYRRGLGWLLGSRMLMLEHVGRRSGEARYAVLEVIGRPAPGRILIASGFGHGSQWYRNLEAEPRCHVSIGRLRRRPAEARLLPADESEEALARYAREHPASWDFLRRVIEEDGTRDPRTIPVVELHVEN